MRRNFDIFSVAVTAFVIIAVTSPRVTSTQLDIGTCGCMCSNEESLGTVSGQFIAPPKPKTEFFKNIRGKRGDVGADGPIGVHGERGISGTVGARGPASPDLIAQKKALPRSCKDLVGNGRTSGIYTIQTESNDMETEVYCDLENAAGGWTLVASVHENNIDGKCSPGDNWSGNMGINGKSTKNWENFRTFGQVDSATSEDFKSPAYFDSPARDVMVWHLANNLLPSEWSNSSFLQYYTSDGFLTRYGGNLQTLFNKHFPLIKTNTSAQSSGLVEWMDGLTGVMDDIRAVDPHYHTYEYDGPGGPVRPVGPGGPGGPGGPYGPTSRPESSSGASSWIIRDGGHDMFDGGNMVQYKINEGDWKRITYEQSYISFEHNVQIYSKTFNPFIMLMWIGNEHGTLTQAGIQVSADTGADGEGQSQSYQNTVMVGDTSCSYSFYNVYGAGDASIGELYFSCSNIERWNSTPGMFVRDHWSSGTSQLENGFLVTGSPTNVLAGYLLLSYYMGGDGPSTSQPTVERILRIFMGQLATFNGVEGIDCGREDETLAVPVQFLKGSVDEVMNGIPVRQRNHVEPGFIQFRPVSFEGKSYALCPGIKSKSCNPSNLCVAGQPRDGDAPAPDDETQCGDFAGWQSSNSTAGQVNPNSRSQDYIGSTILIFTR